MRSKLFALAKLCGKTKRPRTAEWVGKLLINDTYVAAVDPDRVSAVVARHGDENVPCCAVSPELAADISGSGELVVVRLGKENKVEVSGQKGTVVFDLDTEGVESGIRCLLDCMDTGRRAIVSIMLDLRRLKQLVDVLMAAFADKNDLVPAIIRIVDADTPVEIMLPSHEARAVVMPIRPMLHDQDQVWPRARAQSTAQQEEVRQK